LLVLDLAEAPLVKKHCGEINQQGGNFGLGKASMLLGEVAAAASGFDGVLWFGSGGGCERREKPTRGVQAI
jgi:hypothetical protein